MAYAVHYDLFNAVNARSWAGQNWNWGGFFVCVYFSKYNWNLIF